MKSRVSVKQTNPGWAKKIAARVTELANKEVAAGFPRGSSAGSETYDNGASVLDVAIWNQFGADINHPGGTPYFIRADGMAQFVAKGSPGSSGLPKTKPHRIKVPARPFIDYAAARIENDPGGSTAEIAKKVINGEVSPQRALREIAQVAEAAIKTTIDDSGLFEPNAKSTIDASVKSKKAYQRASKKKKAQFLADARAGGKKPLKNTGKMRQAVTSVVRDRSE